MEVQTAMDTKAEKLAQARKKLRDYQSKHRSSNRDETSSPCASASSLNENSGRLSAASLQYYNHNEKKSLCERVRTMSQGSPSPVENSANHNNLITTSSAPNNNAEYKIQQNVTIQKQANVSDDNSDIKQECVRLREQLASVLYEKEELSAQFAELVGHYSQIHSAYTKLREGVENGNPDQSALQTQLTHLQTAISVVVKEKTALQQRLRELNDLAEDRSKQIHSLNIDLNDKSSRIMSLEAEISILLREIESLNNAMQKQAEQSEIDRKEAINWQAKVLRVQQDRNDAQERLRICMKEMEAAQVELEKARKQLRMKDIHIRQLGAYGGPNASTENDIQNFSDETEILKNDLARALSDSERWKKEAQLAREHYESYGTQLNQNIMQMSNKLEELSHEKLLLESKVETLESQIEMLETMDCKRILTNNESNSVSVEQAELQNVQDKLAETVDNIQALKNLNEDLREKLLNKEQEVLVLSSALKDMESELSEKNSELIHTKESLARALSFADEQQKHTEGALSLSEQLQNEKATVSRAIAQNRELKEQLIELQDKLIAVTQESMERESGRLSALHLVDQLRKQIDQLNLHSTSDTSVKAAYGDAYEQHTHVDSREETVSTPSVSECDDHESTLQHAEDARAHAEVELAMTKMALDELRTEHRRVVQENEELRRIMEQNSEDENQNNIHVELGQAVERISTLFAENQQLRNDVTVLQDKLQNSVPQDSNGFSVQCSEGQSCQVNGNVLDHFQVPSIMEKPLAWTELEARFTRAMQQIADLAEEKERLQHIVMQLETENDTIGDYVTLYQHQRKKINERMREREEAVAKLSFEKEQMQQKLNELQKTLVQLLAKKGLLHMYGHEKEAQRSDNRPSKRAREVRSYSHCTTDEFSGDEETVVNGSNMVVPSSPDSCIDIGSECGTVDYDTNGMPEKKDIKRIPEGDADDDVGVQRILNLISELQDLERTRTLPPCSPNLHCSECRGKLINL